jgi:hypothetical protein
VDDVDTELDRGKLPQHGVDITPRNVLLNTSLQSGSRKSTDLRPCSEIRRDIKILSGEHDDWNAAQDDVAERNRYASRHTTHSQTNE